MSRWPPPDPILHPSARLLPTTDDDMQGFTLMSDPATTMLSELALHPGHPCNLSPHERARQALGQAAIPLTSVAQPTPLGNAPPVPEMDWQHMHFHGCTCHPNASSFACLGSSSLSLLCSVPCLWSITWSRMQLIHKVATLMNVYIDHYDLQPAPGKILTPGPLCAICLLLGILPATAAVAGDGGADGFRVLRLMALRHLGQLAPLA
eukprot:gene12564-352_t